MTKSGFARPGALQMLLSVILGLVLSIGPIFVAGMRPNGEWLVILTGFPAAALSVLGIALVLLYAMGFVRYCESKGYNFWVGFVLLLGNIPGFIAMLLLPDLNIVKKEQSHLKDTVAIH